MSTTADSSGRFLSFVLEQREFAFRLDSVREVIGFPEFTPLPQEVPHMLGLMSLREEIIPLVDLRIRIGLEPTLTHDTAVIICRLQSSFVGVVVDSINSVLSPEAQLVINTPSVTDKDNAPIVPQAIRNENGLTLVLDIAEVLKSDEKILLETGAQGAAKLAA